MLPDPNLREAAVPTSTEMPPETESFDSALAAARAAVTRGDQQSAARAYAALVHSYPLRPAGFVGLGQVAQARGDWAAAAEAFEDCLARFPDENLPHVRRALAGALRRLGRPGDALQALRPVLGSDPVHQQDHIAAAITFSELGQWKDALAHWQRAFEQGNEPPRAEWVASYADALLHQRRAEEALSHLRAAVLADQSSAFLLRRYFDLLGRMVAATALIEEAFGLADQDTRVGVKIAGAALAARVNDIERLQTLVDGVLPRLEQVGECAELFTLIPQAFEGWARTGRWFALERRLDAVLRTGGAEAAKAAHGLRMRLRLAFKDYPGFLQLQAFDPDQNQARRWRFARLAEVLSHHPFPHHDAEKIFGVGLPKTGTTSLHAALSELGYLSAHYTNDFTGEVLGFDDAFLFDALSDMPVCQAFELAFQTFPASRFIYTTRPVEDWAGSVERHLARVMGSADLPALCARATGGGKTRFGAAPAAFAVPLLYRHANPLAAREAFEARLFTYFSGDRAGRLLVLDLFAGEAWPKLCAFLGRDAPTTRFPHDNRSLA